MVFFIKEDGVKNILIHTFILPSVEQKANLWNMHPDKLLFKNNFIKPYTMVGVSKELKIVLHSL